MADPSGRPASLVRFDGVSRAVHWLNAGLFLVLVVTGAALYIPALSVVVGRRYLIERIHVVCGLVLPVPVLAGLMLPRLGRAFRADLSLLNRWSTDDRRWLRASLSPAPLRAQAREGLRLGKFNPGQKLNAAFVGGAIVVMLATGSVMYWYRLWPLRWRTGATFVHDWLALGLACVIAGHIIVAVANREALRAMVAGRISRRWAARHAPVWLEELETPAALRPSGATPKDPIPAGPPRSGRRSDPSSWPRR